MPLVSIINVYTSVRLDNTCFLFLEVIGLEIASSELDVYVFAVDEYSCMR